MPGTPLTSLGGRALFENQQVRLNRLLGSHEHCFPELGGTLNSLLERKCAVVERRSAKQLRDKTGAGMGACKKALVETEGDAV